MKLYPGRSSLTLVSTSNVVSAHSPHIDAETERFVCKTQVYTRTILASFTFKINTHMILQIIGLIGLLWFNNQYQ